MKKKWNTLAKKEKLLLIGSLGLFLMELVLLIMFVIFKMDNLMHSDMSAEVLLSKLLSKEHKLISSNWYYSTEIRIVYTHLIMTPLFAICKSYRLVKQISVVICMMLLMLSFLFLAKKVSNKACVIILGLALLFAPLSNEYLDMQLIGNFYTAQTICTFMVLGFFVKEHKNIKWFWIHSGIAFLWGIIMGLSGLRYLASLYAPMVLASLLYMADDKAFFTRLKTDFDGCKSRLAYFVYAVISMAGAFGGFVIHKAYLAKHFSFDQSSVTFVPLDEVPQRFLNSLKLMLEFVGYREKEVMTPIGIVNVINACLLIFIARVMISLWRQKNLLNTIERLLYYAALSVLFINWYLLVFTNVLMQYRYWLPVYIVTVVMIVIFWNHAGDMSQLWRIAWLLVSVCAIAGSLYAELWQDMHYNDCEKRYAYMEFLEKEGYDFGYASFWNASVSEYLSNGEIEFASLGLHEFSEPYDWLQPKAYYQAGYHKGKCFLLLANTEAAGMDKGDFVIMEDAKKVYTDEYYTIYEGQNDMYIVE